MITKHFFKILILFLGMIGLGLIAVFISSYFDNTNNSQVNVVHINDEVIK